MADNHNQTHLDASGPREVVFCHQCENEWYRDAHGLTCPRCEGEITEIISPETDPRPSRPSSPDSLPGLEDMRNHNPWPHPNDDSDPEEADIEEHIQHGPHGIFISRTIRSPGGYERREARPRGPDNDPQNLISDFQNMIGNLMGPTLRNGEVGRSGPDAMFPPPRPSPFGRGHATTIRFGGAGSPIITTQRFTMGGNEPLQPRNADGPQPGGPPVNDLATILETLLGQMAAPAPPVGHDGADHPRGGMPLGLQGLFAQLLNPANAVHGDAVYSQEALDRIISSLMEQHPTSNAPGPAPADAIAALPKKKLDEKMLGPELKGECSVCMDDVHVGDEVVALPCTHWFHENCASAWLSEHNTCPICRKGIGAEEPVPASSHGSSHNASATRNEDRGMRFGISRRLSGQNPSNAGEDRLNYIRERGRLSPTQEDGPGTRGWDFRHNARRPGSVSPPEMSGNRFSTFVRRNSARGGSDADSARGQTSGSDRSRRSSASGNGSGGGSGGGPMSWIRDRLGSNRRQD